MEKVNAKIVRGVMLELVSDCTTAPACSNANVKENLKDMFMCWHSLLSCQWYFRQTIAHYLMRRSIFQTQVWHAKCSMQQH